MPFLVFAAIIWWLYYQLAYVPGGQPIGGLERVFAKLGGLFRRWFSIARRREAIA